MIFANYTYWKCSNCFTSQVLPQPSSEELRSYYEVYHLSEQIGGVYNDVEDRMKADFPTKVKMAMNHATAANPRLLDVGCGKGFLSKQLSIPIFEQKESIFQSPAESTRSIL